MKNEDCTILVGSCDAYSDIWDIFFKLLSRYWPDRPYDIVLSTETKQYKNKDNSIKTINPVNPTISWTARIADALKKIDSKYVILMLDDFFLTDYVQTHKIKECIDWMNKNPEIATITFWPTATDWLETNFSGFGKRPSNAIYKVAAILGIWNKNTLFKYVNGYDESAWEFEVNATKRANLLYPEDDFYIMQNTEDFIFPYDFSKIGLFAGQWFKDTKKFFSKERIKVDFRKRGFYNESLRGLSKSIITAFEMESYLIPFYGLKHTEERIPFFRGEKVTKVGSFSQEYDITDAHSILRWEPAIQWGFSINNLEINVKYMDGSEALIETRKLFGNFININDRLVFNNPTPHVYIPTEPKKIIKTVKLTGKVKMPISVEELRKSYKKETLPTETLHEILYSKLWLEYLLIPEKTSHLCINSKVLFKIKNKYNHVNCLRSKKVIKQGFFAETYDIPESAQEIKWVPLKSSGFAIKNLKIKYVYDNGKEKNVNIKKSSFIKIGRYYVFLDSTDIIIGLPSRRPSSFIITGDFICPIPSHILRKIYISNYKSIFKEPDIIVNIRKQDKQILKKLPEDRFLGVIYRLFRIPAVFLSRVTNIIIILIYKGGRGLLWY